MLYPAQEKDQPRCSGRNRPGGTERRKQDTQANHPGSGRQVTGVVPVREVAELVRERIPIRAFVPEVNK